MKTAQFLEHDETAELRERLRVVESALEKINAIRNSIIGVQGFNFSEHAYPLVAALNEAGFEGLPYPEAKENVGMLIERATKAEDEIERLRILHLECFKCKASLNESEAVPHCHDCHVDDDLMHDWDTFLSTKRLPSKEEPR